MEKIYGYARVSTKEQNLDRQIGALETFGIDARNIITDKASGKDFNRPGYITLKDNLLRSGDTLVIKELDRLGRDMGQIKHEWQELLQMGVNIVILDTPMLNTQNKSDIEKSLISNIVFELLSYMAEKERLKIQQRQAEGIKALKAKNGGKGIGRPSININTLTPGQLQIIKENYDKWTNKEITAVAFMELLELKKDTFYKIMGDVKKFKEKEGLK